MASIDKFPELVQLLRRKECSPTKIAREINSDKRTVNKMLEVGNKLNITVCKSLRIDKREYKACTLSPEFKKILGGKKHGKG